VRGWVWPALWGLAFLPELALARWGGPAAVAACFNLLAGLRFAVTLRPGAVPLITRFARIEHGRLTATGERYTRALTLGWTLLLSGFALLSMASAAGLLAWRSLAMLETALLLLSFLGEHVLRGRILPELGPARPWRTIMAVRGAFRTHGAGSHAA